MTVCGEKVTGVCAMGKCPHIKRCCPVVWDKYGKIKPKTNEEWFCQLSTEEKAEVILKKTTELRLERKWSERYIEEWLKEKHNESV